MVCAFFRIPKGNDCSFLHYRNIRLFLAIVCALCRLPEGIYSAEQPTCGRPLEEDLCGFLMRTDRENHVRIVRDHGHAATCVGEERLHAAPHNHACSFVNFASPLPPLSELQLLCTDARSVTSKLPLAKGSKGSSPVSGGRCRPHRAADGQRQKFSGLD